jgi:hypothetical protein
MRAASVTSAGNSSNGSSSIYEMFRAALRLSCSPNTFVVRVSGVWLGYRLQTLRKFEGGVSFHTALSTAFPQPAPGTPGASPGPITLRVDHLRSVLGITDVSVVRGQDALAVTDLTLAETGAAMMYPTEMESRQ